MFSLQFISLFWLLAVTDYKYKTFEELYFNVVSKHKQEFSIALLFTKQTDIMDIQGSGRCILLKQLFYLLRDICRRPLKNVWRYFIQPSPLLCMKILFCALGKETFTQVQNLLLQKWGENIFNYAYYV